VNDWSHEVWWSVVLRCGGVEFWGVEEGSPGVDGEWSLEV